MSENRDQASGARNQDQKTGLAVLRDTKGNVVKFDNPEGDDRRLFFANMDQILAQPRPKSIRKSMTAFMPLHDQVLVMPIEDDSETDFQGIDGKPIVRPDSSKEKESEGLVVAAGPGGVDVNGRFIPTSVRPNDRVLFGKYSGTEYTLRGKLLRLMRECQILGVIR
jgi:chaperonin GroES